MYKHARESKFRKKLNPTCIKSLCVELLRKKKAKFTYASEKCKYNYKLYNQLL